ncbi:MAG TPA: FKBP-type peptidyl-prolyl cis-trans isomerase [Actinomycetes bacterium]
MRRPLIPLVLALSVAVALAGCSGKSTASASHTPTPSATSTGPMVPVDWTGSTVPTVTGSYGDKPAITFPTSKAPTQLERKILTQGSGPAVGKDDLLVADYYGVVWGAKTAFDNSYDRGQPVGFTIGVGKVIQGWDDTLVGMKAGTRVLISLPPTEGYGSAGNTSAGIKGTDTLVFVVDIVSSYSGAAVADAHAKVQPAVAGLPTITGALATQPTIKIPAKLAKPTKQSTRLLAKGSGPVVGKELVIVQYQVVDWTGAAVASTWTDKSPAGVNVGQTGSTGVFDGLIGLPIGSRVLIELPVSQGQGPYAAVVDIVAVAQSAKLTAAGG